MRSAKAFLTLLLVWVSVTLYAQQNGIQYQAVVRDSNGTTLQNTNVSFQFSIVEDSLQGNILFTEQHVNVQTNEFGIINLVIGSGSATLNTLNGVDWSNPPHFVKIGLDISGGTSFTDMGGFGFYTVPYAYHSVTSDSALNDFDRDPNNELQTIILTGDSIMLSDGGGVNLSHLNDTTAIKDLEALLNQKVAEIKSKSTSDSILFVGVTDSLKSKMVNDSLTLQTQLGNLNNQIDVTDRDSTNEIQTFSLVNDTLRLSKTTGEISFKGYFDNTDSQNLTLVDDTLLVISGSNDTISVGRLNQQLSSSNDTIFLSGGSFVKIAESLDNDTTNEIQSLTRVDDNLIISLTNDTISLSDFTLKIDTTDGKIASLQLEVDTNTTDILNLQNQLNSLPIADTARAIRADLVDSLSTLDAQLSTNLTDSINNTRAQLADTSATLRGLINNVSAASGNGLVDTAQALRASLGNLDSALTNQNIITDSAMRADLVDSLSSLDSQLSSNLADTASALRTEQQTTNSQQLNALSDTATAIRSSLSTLDAQLSTNLTDSSTSIRAQLADTALTLRSLISSSGSDDQNLTLNGKSLEIESGNSVDLSFLSDSAAIVDTAVAIRSSLSTLDSQLSSNLTDTAAAIRADLVDSLSTLDSQLSSNLADTASALRTEQQTANSQQLNALSDTASAIRADLVDSLSTLSSQLSTNLTDSTNNTRAQLADTSATLRGLINNVSAASGNGLVDTAQALRASLGNLDSALTNQIIITDSASRADLVDSLSTLDSQLSSNLADTASALRTELQTANSQQLNTLSDTATDIRSSLSTLDSQLSTNLTDSSTSIRAQLADTALTLRSLISSSGSDDQNLTLNGKSLEIESGNSVDLSFLSDSAAIVDTAFAIRSSLSTLDSQLSSNLTDTAAAIRADLVDSLSALNFQLSTNLADTASALRTELQTANSQQLNNLSDTATAIRSSLSTLDAQLSTNLTDSTNNTRAQLADTSATLRGLINNVSAASGNGLVDTAQALRASLGNLDSALTNQIIITDSAMRTDLVDSLSSLDSQLSSNLADTASALRTEQQTANSQQLSALSDTATAIRSSLSALDSQLSTKITADSTLLESKIAGANSDNQNLSLNGDTLFITDGDSVNLSSFNNTNQINALANKVVQDSTVLRNAINTNFGNIGNNQTDIANLTAKQSSDSLLLSSQINDVDSAIRADLVDSLSTLDSLLSSNLADTASALRTEQQTANSQQLNALSDTATVIRSSLSTLDAQLSTNLTDSSTSIRAQLADTALTLRSLITSSGSDDQNLTLNGKSLEIESGNSVDLRSLSDSAIQANIDSSTAIRADLADSLSTLDFQLSSNLSDTASNIRGTISTIRSDISTNQADISSLQSDVSTNQGDISTLQSDVSKIQSDITSLQAGLKNTQDSTADIYSNLTDSSLTLRSVIADTAAAIRSAISSANTDNQTLQNVLSQGKDANQDTIRNLGVIGIGTDNPLSKFDLVDSTQVTSGGYASSTIYAKGTATSGVFQRALNVQIQGTDGENEGIFAISNGTSSGDNTGIIGRADNSLNNTGVFGHASATPAGTNFAMGVNGTAFDSTGGINYGVYGSASGSNFINRGVVGVLIGTNTSNDAAIYGIANSTGKNNVALYGRSAFSNAGGINYGLYTRATGADTNYAAYFESGDVYIRDYVGLNTKGRVADEALTIRTADQKFGWMHTNGDVSLGSWIYSDVSPTNKGGAQIGTFSNHRLDFITNNSQPKMSIDTLGRVGIGTTSPISKLSVVDATTAPYIGIEGVSSGFDYAGIIMVAATPKREAWLTSHRSATGEEHEYLLQYFNGNTYQQKLQLDTLGSLTLNNAFTFPNIDGDPGQVLTTDGSGNVTFQTPAAGSDDQNLTLSANTLSIEDGNSVDLSGYDQGTAVTTNALDISTLQGDVSTAQTDISNNNTAIISNQTDISTLQSDMTSAQSDIITNTGDVTANTIDIATASDSIRLLQDQIDGLPAGSDDQTITFTQGTNILSIENGNTADLSFLSDTAKIRADSLFLKNLIDNNAAADNDTSATNELITNFSITTTTIGITDAAGAKYIDVSHLDQSSEVSTNASDITTLEGALSDTASTLRGLIDNVAAASTSLTDLSDAKKLSNSLFIGTVPSALVETTEKWNTSAGVRTLESLTTGIANTAFGYWALGKTTTGINNSAFGSEALRENTTGLYNTAVGDYALVKNTLGYQNTATGTAALRAVTTGDNNVSVGFYSGDILITGNNNLLLGASANPSSTAASNQIVIGQGATGTGDNQAVIGNANVTDVYMSQDAGATLHAADLNLGGVDVTATAAELNLLAGVTSLNSGATNLNGLSDGLVETNSMYIGNDPSATTSTAERNVALGTTALDAITTGDNNIAIGYDALSSNTSGSGNAATGYQALRSNTTGVENTAVGYLSLNSNNGNFNTAVGGKSLKNNSTGSSNTAVGMFSMEANSTGSKNSVFGYASLGVNTVGNQNAALGTYALRNNTIGNSNTANGYNALNSNVAGSNGTAIGAGAMHYANNSTTAFTNTNVAVGYEALKGSTTAANNTGNDNTAIGYQTLLNNTTGHKNTASGNHALSDNTIGNWNTSSGNDALSANTIGNNNTASGNGALKANISGNKNASFGSLSLFNNATGINNTALGYEAGKNLIDGNSNVFVGMATEASVSNATNQIVIGNNAIGTGDNQAVIGNANVTDVYMSQDAGATLHAADLNLGGVDVTATAAELNFVTGVTSSIQTQLDAKVSLPNGSAAGEMMYWDGTSWLAIAPAAQDSAIFMFVNGVPTWVGGTPPPPAIGDLYQGGIVFWLDGNGGGLIAALTDQSTGAQWGCYGALISGADGTAIGTGNQNTIDIEAGCTTTGTASDICANLTLGGYSDWFLPSKDELNQLYINKTTLEAVSGFTAFNISYYWSSTEYSNLDAWIQWFGNGGQTVNGKIVNYAVRAVRAF